jgi:hypothetical protein
MTVTTHKITDTMAGRASAARHLMAAKVMPYAVPASRKVSRQASEQASRQLQQAKILVQDRIVPMASSAMDNAMTASAPVRAEAMRRGKLAAAALRGDETIAKMASRAPSRSWLVAAMFLAIGGAIGAAVAWLSQAGRPVQLSPYPLATERDEPQAVDLTEQEQSHQEH